MRYSLTFGEQLQKFNDFFKQSIVVKQQDTLDKDILNAISRYLPVDQTNMSLFASIKNVSCWNVNPARYTVCIFFKDPSVKSVRGFVTVREIPSYFTRCKDAIFNLLKNICNFIF